MQVREIRNLRRETSLAPEMIERQPLPDRFPLEGIEERPVVHTSDRCDPMTDHGRQRARTTPGSPITILRRIP